MLKSKYLHSIYVVVPEYKSSLFPTMHQYERKDVKIHTALSTTIATAHIPQIHGN
jgi:hypothetical protein